MKNEKIKFAIEEYQCSGCVSGMDISCFEKNELRGVGCGKHLSGTIILGIGKLFLGMPKGFNRLGKCDNMQIFIYENFDNSGVEFNMYNIPVWKHKDKNNNTLVRGIRPRLNEPFLCIFLEDCIDKINCLEISQDNIDFMD